MSILLWVALIAFAMMILSLVLSKTLEGAMLAVPFALVTVVSLGLHVLAALFSYHGCSIQITTGQ